MISVTSVEMLDLVYRIDEIKEKNDIIAIVPNLIAHWSNNIYKVISCYIYYCPKKEIK